MKKIGTIGHIDTSITALTSSKIKFDLHDVVKSFYCHDNKFGDTYKCLSQCKECKKDSLKQ